MKRIPELDALRGLAALTIVVHHADGCRHGFLGTATDLFFVLSGYLITTIILDEGGAPGFLRKFYVRRSLRIWPIYYLSLLGLVLVSRVLPTPLPLAGLPYYLSYTQRIQDYWSGQEPAFFWAFGHTWTLAIEEQFYLIWPALVLAGGRRWVAPTAVAFAGAAVVARCAGMPPWVLLSRCDGLALGGVLAVLRPGSAESRGRAGDGVALAAVMLAALAYVLGGRILHGALAPWGAPEPGGAAYVGLRLLAFNALFFGLVGLVIRHSGHPALAPLRGRRLCALGTISYGLYLYHYPLMASLEALGGRLGLEGPWWLGSADLAGSLALAGLSWRYVERPILSLKGRFEYRSGPTPRGVPEVSGLGAVG